MDSPSTQIAFFSPTQTTENIVRAIARGRGEAGKSFINFTYQTPEPRVFGDQDLLVVGMPVYGGRLPPIAVERFQALEGRDTPVVAVVVYGNRHYDDALAELCDRCVAQGFQLIAAAAFVGQHSFSSANRPIAANRPDSADLEAAERLGRQLEEVSASLDLDQIPGTRPYGKQPMQPGPAATSANLERCIGCGQCELGCPVACISMDGKTPITQPDGCIWCMACVQVCPVGAREITLSKIHASAQRLHENFSLRREPEIFRPIA